MRGAEGRQLATQQVVQPVFVVADIGMNNQENTPICQSIPSLLQHCFWILKVVKDHADNDTVELASEIGNAMVEVGLLNLGRVEIVERQRLRGHFDAVHSVIRGKKPVGLRRADATIQHLLSWCNVSSYQFGYLAMNRSFGGLAPCLAIHPIGVVILDSELDHVAIVTPLSTQTPDGIAWRRLFQPTAEH